MGRFWQADCLRNGEVGKGDPGSQHQSRVICRSSKAEMSTIQATDPDITQFRPHSSLAARSGPSLVSRGRFMPPAPTMPMMPMMPMMMPVLMVSAVVSLAFSGHTSGGRGELVGHRCQLGCACDQNLPCNPRVAAAFRDCKLHPCVAPANCRATAQTLFRLTNSSPSSLLALARWCPSSRCRTRLWRMPCPARSKLGGKASRQGNVGGSPYLSTSVYWTWVGSQPPDSN